LDRFGDRRQGTNVVLLDREVGAQATVGLAPDLLHRFAMSTFKVIGWSRRGGAALRRSLAVSLTFAIWFAAGRAGAQSSPPAPDSQRASPWEAPSGQAPQADSWGTPTPPAAPATIDVDLQANNPNVRLDRMVGNLTVPVCLAPCRRSLPRDGIYVIQGDGVPATSRFQLPDDRQRVTLDVHAGSSGRRIVGATLIVAGVVAAYAGLLAADANSLGNGSDTSSSGGVWAPSSWTLALLGGGLVATLAGAYLCLTTHTTVVSSTGNTFTVAPAARKHSRFALTPRGLEF
jgi:hypothetical protein